MKKKGFATRKEGEEKGAECGKTEKALYGETRGGRKAFADCLEGKEPRKGAYLDVGKEKERRSTLCSKKGKVFPAARRVRWPEKGGRSWAPEGGGVLIIGQEITRRPGGGGKRVEGGEEREKRRWSEGKREGGVLSPGAKGWPFHRREMDQGGAMSYA